MAAIYEKRGRSGTRNKKLEAFFWDYKEGIRCLNEDRKETVDNLDGWIRHKMAGKSRSELG